MSTEGQTVGPLPAWQSNHHLWNNNGTFCCHLTIHLADFTKQRLRLSLESSQG